MKLRTEPVRHRRQPGQLAHVMGLFVMALGLAIAGAIGAVPGLSSVASVSACVHDIEFYKNSNYMGSSFTGCNTGNPNIGSLWNDQISSLQGAAHSSAWGVRIYADENYHACNKLFKYNGPGNTIEVANLQDYTNTCDTWAHDWNDDMTSWKFE